jgi:hypothetical protein
MIGAKTPAGSDDQDRPDHSVLSHYFQVTTISRSMKDNGDDHELDDDDDDDKDNEELSETRGSSRK